MFSCCCGFFVIRWRQSSTVVAPIPQTSRTRAHHAEQEGEEEGVPGFVRIKKQAGEHVGILLIEDWICKGGWRNDGAYIYEIVEDSPGARAATDLDTMLLTHGVGHRMELGCRIVSVNGIPCPAYNSCMTLLRNKDVQSSEEVILAVLPPSREVIEWTEKNKEKTKSVQALGNSLDMLITV